MSYKLFLDDIRDPIQVAEYYYPIEERYLFKQPDWVIVRNYEDFVRILKNRGIPDVVAFDHDLGEDIAQYEFQNGLYSKRKARARKKDIKNGLDCAKALLDEIIDKRHRKTINILVHSQNPVGKQRIINLFTDSSSEYKDI